MHQNRIDTKSKPETDPSTLIRDTGEQAQELGGEIVARVKQFAAEKPVVVVAAGLAIGVLAGLILKRK